MPRNSAAKHCTRPGCRAWAIRGEVHCSAHRGHDDLSDGRDERSRAFAEAVRRGDKAALVDAALAGAIADGGGELSLEQEIGALRLILRRVVAMDALDGDPESVARTMTRLVEAIVRATRMQHS